MLNATTNHENTGAPVSVTYENGAPFFVRPARYSRAKDLRRQYEDFQDFQRRQARLVTLSIPHRGLFAFDSACEIGRPLYSTAEVRAGGIILRREKNSSWEKDGAGIEARMVAAYIAQAWELRRRIAGARLSIEAPKTRGVICGITAASRRRFRGELMKIDWKKQTGIGKAARAVFITLTYPGAPPLVTVTHDHDAIPQDQGPTQPPAPETWQWVDIAKVKRDLDTFGKRLMRYRRPKGGKGAGAILGGVWKMEIEERKSGAAAGEYAAHFHVTVFFAWPVWIGAGTRKTAGGIFSPVDFKGGKRNTAAKGFRAWVAGAWSEIVNTPAPPDLDVGPCRPAAPVVTREMLDHLQAGTQVKAVYMRDENPLKLAAYLCKYMSKEFAIERVLSSGEIVKNHTGKCWGIIGKPPFFDSMNIDIPAKNQWFTLFLRLRVLRESSPYLKNLSPYCPGAQIWGPGLDLAKQLLDDLPPPADCSEWFNPLFSREGGADE